jgi:ribosomal protein S10
LQVAPVLKRSGTERSNQDPPLVDAVGPISWSQNPKRVRNAARNDLRSRDPFNITPTEFLVGEFIFIKQSNVAVGGYVLPLAVARVDEVNTDSLENPAGSLAHVTYYGARSWTGKFAALLNKQPEKKKKKKKGGVSTAAVEKVSKFWEDKNITKDGVVLMRGKMSESTGKFDEYTRRALSETPDARWEEYKTWTVVQATIQGNAVLPKKREVQTRLHEPSGSGSESEEESEEETEDESRSGTGSDSDALLENAIIKTRSMTSSKGK